MVYDFSIFPQGAWMLLFLLVIKFSSSYWLAAMALWNYPTSITVMKMEQVQYSHILEDSEMMNERVEHVA